MNVLSTMIVLWIRHVSLRNVSTHATANSVETEPSVRWITIKHTVSVPRASKEILLLAALMWNADMMKTVDQMRSVMRASRNASKSASENLVAPLMQSARHRITKSAAIAHPLSLEMAMFTVA